MICGLTRGAHAGHIVRAALESMAYQTKDVFDIMKAESKRAIVSLRVDGGACANNFLMQFQADMLGCRILRPKVTESTALGAAQLAGVTTGIWTKKDLDRMHTAGRTFEPKMKSAQRDALYRGWLTAVKKANG